MNNNSEARHLIDGVSVFCAFDEIVNIKDLKENPRNPNTHPSVQIELLAQIIKKTGWRAPITVSNLSGFIVKGHGRLQAAQAAGLKQCPVEYQNFKDKEEEMSALLADNKLAELAEIDVEKLTEIFKDYEFEDLSLTGYSKEEFDELVEVFEEAQLLGDPEEVPEEVETRCKLGDMWQLGNHRLMCGDSTSKSDVEKLMNGNKADMVFTDPPYGMKKEKDGVLNDNLNFDALLEFNRQWIPLTFANTKDNGSWYCWGIDEPLMDIYGHILKPMIKNKQIAFRNLITWDKGNGQGQLNKDFRMYPIADEKCLFVMIGGDSIQDFCVNADDYSENMDKVRLYLEKERDKAGLTNALCKRIVGHSEKSGCHWFDKSQFSLPTKDVYTKWQEYCLKNNIDAFKKDYDDLKKIYDDLKKDFYAGRSYFDNSHDNMNNVWHFHKTSQEERKNTGGHATPKPIALCSRAIKSSSREQESVLDVFGGSGSTLIACEQLKRKCYMMELDPHYCDVIITRWETLTGKKAELIT